MFTPSLGRADEWAATYGSLGAMPQAQLTQLPLNALDPWQGAAGEEQPFSPYSEDKLLELCMNIKANGVIEPICVRPKADGRFEVIAGHNRCAAARMAGLLTVPALVRTMDDDQAAILLVDSNLKHRETLLISERAKAYKLRLDAMRHQGKTTSAQNGQKLGSREELARELGESSSNVQRYIRLTNLIPHFLALVDKKKMRLNAAEDISFLPVDEQEMLIKYGPLKKAQTEQLRAISQESGLTPEAIESIMQEPPKSSPAKISVEPFMDYFPSSTTPEEIQAELLKAIEFYRNEGKE